MTPDAEHPRPTDASPIELDHVTVENEDAPNECTIFPREASEEQLDTQWIAALEDGFVSLDSMR